MTLNAQREKELLRRRGSTPVAPLFKQLSGPRDLRYSASNQPSSESFGATRSHPPLGQSASYHPGDKSFHYRAQWSSDSDDDSQSESDCVYRVVLLGDHGVGKTSLAGIFAGITEKDEQPGGELSSAGIGHDGLVFSQAFFLTASTLYKVFNLLPSVDVPLSSGFHRS